jgi:hypothetical protein
MKIWAGQYSLAAHTDSPKGQHVVSWWLYYDLNFICFSNFTSQSKIDINFAKGDKILKKSLFDIAGNYHLVKYNILIAYLVENTS